MSRDRGYGKVGVVLRPAEPHPRLFGHPFNLQGKNLELFEHTFDRGRHHTEVFGARQHRRTPDNRGQLLQRLFTPKAVMTHVIEIVIKVVESNLLASVEPHISRGKLGSHARMIKAPTLFILNKEYIRQQSHQFIA